jgi:multiple RNA-binding domain-containing protein 1
MVNPPASKLEEYLDVMKAPSNSKASFFAQAEQKIVGLESSTAITHEIDENASQKRKKVDPESKQTTAVVETVRKNAHGASPELEEPVSVNQDPDQSTSDQDWLRSHTRRLLDLEDQTITEEAYEKPVDLEPSEERHVSLPSADIQAQEISDVPVQPTAGIEEQSERQSGRLFIRNLAYNVSEDELKEFFHSFGAVKDVSNICRFFETFGLHDEIPDRDNRLFLMITRENILVDASHCLNCISKSSFLFDSV